MKKIFKNISFILVALTLFVLAGCGSKPKASNLPPEETDARFVLIASGDARLVKIDLPDNKILPDTELKALKSASLDLSIYSGRKPKDGAADGTPVVKVSFDLLKDSDKFIKGYDLMSAEKDTKVSAADLNKALSANQYYYAKGEVIATTGSKETKKIIIFSNDTVYTPVAE
jgi:predicted small lipoprotein YifL